MFSKKRKRGSWKRLAGVAGFYCGTNADILQVQNLVHGGTGLEITTVRGWEEYRRGRLYLGEPDSDRCWNKKDSVILLIIIPFLSFFSVTIDFLKVVSLPITIPQFPYLVTLRNNKVLLLL